LHRLLESRIAHQLFSQVIEADITRATAHETGVLGDDGIGVIPGAVEQREQAMSFVSSHRPRPEVFKQGCAVDRREGGRSQRTHLGR